ncbi:UpxY family transcription antiterminator [Sediminitomix flava]|uniref:Transcription antitermination factor NusG n=1 Tax=Sediminitomix flava TaxID=379075 RepID=A0A315ZDU2_SEDFL|nr:UpxY family transcription antiterminator [Sediminitomix flava]PWJ43320.1 transcription antitermination factor NusG [Sediminitomix flava]
MSTQDNNGLKTIKRPERIPHWTAIYTKSRSEKKVADRLEEAGFEVYCPTLTTLRQWSDRKKKVTVPVFSSYVFIKVAPLEQSKVLQDSGVVNFVFWLGEIAKIKEEEIFQLKRIFENSDQIASTEVINFQKGDKVKIQAPSFLGQEGIIEEIKGKTVHLRIEALMMDLKVVLKANELDLID